MKLDTIIANRGLKTIYRDGDYAIKVFCEGYKKSDILNEALNQSRIEETGLHLPKIEEVTKIDGKWAIVSQFIPGKTMAQLMDENPDMIDDYLKQFVDVQLDILSRRSPLLNKLKDKMQRKIDEAALDPTTRYDLHSRLAGMKKHEKVCHGDFNPSNIIMHEKEGVPYVIDWAHVTQGNASADAARTYLLFRLAKREELAEKYMQLFCAKSKTEMAYVQQWLPIVAASQSVKGKPEERDLLLKWAQVMEYE